MSMWRDFKTFTFKPAVIELAVGVVIGAAFTKFIGVFVAAIIMPALGQLFHGSHASWAPGGIKLGEFLGAVVDFFVVAFALYLTVGVIKKYIHK
jgi:large conductance mechanosensitive channel